MAHVLNTFETYGAAKEEKKKEPVKQPVQQPAQQPAQTVTYRVAQPAESTPAKQYDKTVPSVFGDTSDPQLTAQYQGAMAALEKMKGQAPTYGSQYDAQIQSLYAQIMGRGPFQYDQKTDPLYQQYVQDYTTQGKMAMRDTMGQAAALTGGYGSSYAQAVGQQQYDQYLQRMADILPETYGMALDAYNAQGDQLQRNLETTSALERSDYDKYLDSLNQYNIDLNRAQSDADTWYTRMKSAEQEAYDRQMDQYKLQKDQYSKLMGLMAAGYAPSKAEYNAAGLSEAQGEALRAQYAPPPTPTYVYVREKANAGDTVAADTAGKGVSSDQYNGIMRTIQSSASAADAYSRIANSSVYAQLSDSQRTAVANALAKKK